MWERGVHEPALARRPLASWLAVVAAVASLGLVTALAGMESGPAGGLGFGAAAGDLVDPDPAGPDPAGPDPAGTDPADADQAGTDPANPGEPADPGHLDGRETAEPALPVRPEHLYTLDGSDPEAFPGEVTGLGFLALDDPVGNAYRELGPPQEQHPDINATIANTWTLPGGAEFVAVAASEDADDPVLGLFAEVPEGSAVRFAIHGGVVLGRSTPAEVASAWGSGHDRAAHPGDDYVIRYTLCRGPWPVVVKFDQPGEESWAGAPVTRLLIAYTDDDPATAGCPAT